MIGLSRILPDLVAPPMVSAAHPASGLHEMQWESGVAEGRRLADAAHMLDIAQRDARHRTEIALMREEWCRDESVLIAIALKQQVADAGHEIASAVSQILEAVIAGELPKTALKSMQSEIRAAFRADVERRIALAGSHDMTVALAGALKAEGIEVTAAEAPGTLEASAEGFVIVSMLESWLEELRRG